MTFIVNDSCIKCRFTDCVEVCPVDCFYVGENMLVINPDECIDCGVCEPECPAEAILPDNKLDPNDPTDWVALNAKFSEQWPNISSMIPPLSDADDYNPSKKNNGKWEGGSKLHLLSEEPGEGN